MIYGLESYPQMKNSGVPWLGKVPGHWRAEPLSRLGPLFKGRGGSKEDEQDSGVPCVRYGDLYSRHEFFIESTKAFVDAGRSSAYTPIQYGDVLFAASGETIDDIGRSAVNLLEVDAVCGGDVIVLRPTESLRARFLGYAADSASARWQKARMGRGYTVVHIYGSELKRLTLPVPPLDEQDAIVRFLDHADRRIRRYIRAKQKLIKLLEEQKQAIIHRAVTRGLDPDVRLRPSGVDWLGDVPEHWEVLRFKNVASHVVDCLHATPVYTELGQFPAIRTADIVPGAVRLHSARRVDDETFKRWTERLEPAAGDILYSREGERFGIAACVPPDIRLCISQRMMVFRIRAKHSSAFVMWMLNSSQTYAQASQDVMGSTAPHVNVTTIRNFALALPRLDEQCRIVEHINSEFRAIGPIADVAAREIDLLREYRTRLIADVVTGKLDVREAAARLPEEDEEFEPLEEFESEGVDDMPDDDEADTSKDADA